MENLNAEQIIKALEQFHHRILNTKLAEKVTESEIIAVLDALALINQLTEENERLRASSVDYRNIPYIKAEVRADAVKHFAERLKARKFTHKNFGELVYVEDIDQTKKEMEGVCDT